MKQFLKRKKGVSLVSYALLLGLIGVITITAISNIGSQVNNLFGVVAEDLEVVVAANAPAAECAIPGDICLDSSILTGNSPDGGAQLFVMACDHGAWEGTLNDDSSACTGTATNVAWGPTATTTGVTDVNTGSANTAVLVGLAGSYPAAEYCDALEALGHADWYLPSSGELNQLFLNKDTVVTVGTFSNGQYWSSTETGPNGAIATQIFSTGLGLANTKTASRSMRCVRKG